MNDWEDPQPRDEPELVPESDWHWLRPSPRLLVAVGIFQMFPGALLTPMIASIVFGETGAIIGLLSASFVQPLVCVGCLALAYAISDSRP